MPPTIGLKWKFLLVLASIAVLLVLFGKSDNFDHDKVPTRNAELPTEPRPEGHALSPETDLQRERRRQETLAKIQNEEAAHKRLLGLAWTYRNATDAMTGDTIRQAAVSSENQMSFDFPYQGPQRARLTIRHHPRWGLGVIVEIERGQFMPCGGNDCTIEVRFDDGGLVTYPISPPESSETTVRFIGDAEQFLETARRSTTTIVEATFFQEGTKRLTFNTSGLEWD